MQLLQTLVGQRSPDSRYPSGPAARMHERIDHRAVVGAVAGGLHDDVPREAEVVAQRVELRFRRVARRVFALRRIRERPARSEHVAMRVHAAGRHFELRFRRGSAPVQPAGGFLKFHMASYWLGPAKHAPLVTLVDVALVNRGWSTPRCNTPRCSTAHAGSIPWRRFAASACGEARKESNIFAAAGQFDAVHSAAEKTVVDWISGGS